MADDFLEIEYEGDVHEFPSSMSDEEIAGVMQGVRETSRVKVEPVKQEEVVDVVRQAAETVGIDPVHALAIAQAESSMRPDAKNPRSTASGLFQFIDKTWANTVRAYGPKHGVTEGDVFDPYFNALMGAELIKETQTLLERQIGRAPSLSETYLAHFSGAGRAVRIIKAIDKDPEVLAVKVWDKAAIAANPKIFPPGVKAIDAVKTLTRRVTRAAGRFEQKVPQTFTEKRKAEPPRQPRGGGDEPLTVQVQKGDTLSKIAAQQGVELKELIQANPQIKDPNLINIGQELTIPGKAQEVVEREEEPLVPGKTQEVVEQEEEEDEGPLIPGNAKAFMNDMLAQTPLKKLAKTEFGNDMLSKHERGFLVELVKNDPAYKAGRSRGVIEYEEYPSNFKGVRFTENVGKEHFTDKERVVKTILGQFGWERLDNNTIRINDRFNFNDAEKLQKENPTVLDKVENLMKYAATKPGTYGLLRRIAGLWGSKEGEGAKIKFVLNEEDATPASDEGASVRTEVVTVKKGDTLGEIAKKHGTTVKELQKLNGIDNPNQIAVGQTIRID